MYVCCLPPPSLGGEAEEWGGVVTESRVGETIYSLQFDLRSSKRSKDPGLPLPLCACCSPTEEATKPEPGRGRQEHSRRISSVQ